MDLLFVGHLFQCKKETKESAVLVLFFFFFFFFFKCFQSRRGLFIFSIISFLVCPDFSIRNHFDNLIAGPLVHNAR